MATCVEAMTCWPTSVMEIWRLYQYQYGLPVPLVLGLFVGIIILSIYVHNRSMAMLSVLGIYAISVFSAMWLSESFFDAQIKTAIYVIAVSMASVIVMLVLKLVKE